jgi:hypothetical protein
MKFGDKLLCSQHPPWSENYIDYIRLKQLLHTLFEESSSPDDVDNDEEGGEGGSSRHTTFGQEFGEEGPAGSESDKSDRHPLLHHPSVSNGNYNTIKTDSGNCSDAGNSRYGSITMSNIPTIQNNNNIHHSSSSLNIKSRPTSVSSTHSFEVELKYEIQKSLLFLLKTLGELSTDLSCLLKRHRDLVFLVEQQHHQQQQQSSYSSEMIASSTSSSCTTKTHLLQDIENLRWEFIVRIGSTLLLLLEYVELNIEAIVKIVKKHDKCLSKWERKIKNKSEECKMMIKTKNCTRLRRQYLPRFAVYSSDPNVRCLFLAAADAGDVSGSNKAGISTRKESGNFGGWDVMQWNLEVALRELFELEQQLRNGGGSSMSSTMANVGFGGNGIRQTERPMPPRPATATARSQSVFTLNGSITADDSTPRHRSRPSSAVDNFLTRSTTFLNVNSNVLSSLKSGSSAFLSSLKLSPSNANMAIGRTTTSFFEPMLYRIQSHRHRIGQMHDRYTRMVYAHEMLYLIGDTKQIQRDDDKYILRGQEDFGSVEKLENIRRQSIGGDLDGKKWMEEGGMTNKTTTVSKFSKLLNLASASLYMCNYNIVAPTSGLYAKMLGFDPACAGIIIGMTPMAVIVSCVLYSWWSSYSYKRAIIFASFSCIVGNLVYALALPCKSMKMVLIGRVLTGFGSARVINRRYIGEM